jgi:hypothetical protein
MRKRVTTIATAVALIMAMAIPAIAGPPAGTGAAGMPAGIECQQAGIGTLQSLGLLSSVARTGVDTNVGSFSFQEVLALHRSNPELFQSGTPVRILRVGSLNIGGEGLEPTWCD